jgi:hypothetical protein
MATKWVRRIAILLGLALLVSFGAWAVPRALDPTDRTPEKRAQDKRWVESSPYFWDRQACRWVGLCGLHHLRRDPASRDQQHGREWPEDDKIRGELRRRRATDWEDGAPRRDEKRNVRDRRRVLRDIPDYVNRHAPLVHLYSGEEFWPSDIKEHVEHMTVFVDDECLNNSDHRWTLHNLHELNALGDLIRLRSNDDVETRPDWLHSHHNIPQPYEDDPGEVHKERKPSHPHGRPRDPIEREPTTWYDVDKSHPPHRISDPRRLRASDTQQARRLTTRGHRPDGDGYSRAPAVLVVVDKGSGVVDAFWFFFYSYNLGQTVLGLRFGNHVGDWEHCMVRFENGVPRGVFFSEHEGGQAYAWEAVEKSADGTRPVIYSAVGSHAMYPLPGPHPYIIPFGLLKDVTDRGPLWDPSLNKYAYHYDYTLDTGHGGDSDQDAPGREQRPDPDSLVPAAENPSAPTSWFHFAGRWGDEVYSLADPRQWRLFGQYHYVTGPDGPKFKSLNRSKLCQLDNCRIAYELDPRGTWY